MSSTSHYQYAQKELDAFNTWLASSPETLAAFTYENVQWLQHYQTRLFSILKKGPQDFPDTVTTFKEKIFVIGLRSLNWLTVMYAMCRSIRIAIYSVDVVGLKGRDMRISDVYEGLDGYRYVEIFHTIVSINTFKNIYKRKRLGICLEGIKAESFVAPIPKGGTELQKKLFQKLMVWQGQTLGRLKYVSGVFQKLQLKVLFAIDDSRYHHVCVKAAQKAGAYTVLVQHGHFTKYHAGFIRNTILPEQYVIPDTYLLWSGYWKKELERLGSQTPPTNLTIAGYQSHISTKEVVRGKEPIHVVVPFESDAPFEEVSPYIVAIAENPRFSVTIKLRGDRSEYSQIQQYNLPEHIQKKILFTTTLPASMPVDIVAGTYSTYLYDLALQGVRVAIFKTSLDYASDMISNGIATLVTNNQLIPQLETILLSSHTVVRHRLLEGVGTTMKQTVATIIAKKV